MAPKLGASKRAGTHPCEKTLDEANKNMAAKPTAIFVSLRIRYHLALLLGGG